MSVVESELDLADYLRANPNIFQQHPQLLELVTLDDSRGTASLLERQVAMLKERLQESNNEYTQLLNRARENEKIAEKFKSVLTQFIRYNTLAEFSAQLPNTLCSTFDIQQVTIKTDTQPAVYADTLRRLANHRAVCDNRWPSAIMQFFFDQAIASAAIVPMRLAACDEHPHGQVLGILALGSNDPEHYNNNLDTIFLDWLGIMSGTCLARLQM